MQMHHDSLLNEARLMDHDADELEQYFNLIKQRLHAPT
jgi:hypothetical protein